MRIVDYLHSDEDDGQRHETATPHAPILNQSRKSRKTSRFKLVSRVFSFTWKCGRGTVTKLRDNEEEEQCQEEGDSVGSQGRICGRCRIRFATSQNQKPGCDQQELNFNIVAGLGLMSLIAANKMELEKTMEIRRQMESYLQNQKQECERKNKISEQSESEISCLNENATHGPCEHHFCENGSPEISIAPSDITLVCDQFLKSDASSKEECIQGMNQFENLEVEMETELKLLQLHLQTEESSQQHKWQIKEDSQGLDTEMMYCQQEDDIDQFGVNPYELERRLHELIEARQDERIRELESILKQTRQKLQDHKTEASWLKDTTMIISNHLPESSSVAGV
ncbi:hypothetical protein V2J09_003361 [Rumex salicifolius]